MFSIQRKSYVSLLSQLVRLFKIDRQFRNDIEHDITALENKRLMIFR